MRFSSVSICTSVFMLTFSGCGESKQERLTKAASASLNASKQNWFDCFHPIGKATGIVLHDIQNHASATGKQTSARFTIYWQGPITNDGFTKVQATYDDETKRWVRAEILETNGLTKTQAIEGFGEIIGGLLTTE